MNCKVTVYGLYVFLPRTVKKSKRNINEIEKNENGNICIDFMVRNEYIILINYIFECILPKMKKQETKYKRNYIKEGIYKTGGNL